MFSVPPGLHPYHRTRSLSLNLKAATQAIKPASTHHRIQAVGTFRRPARKADPQGQEAQASPITINGRGINHRTRMLMAAAQVGRGTEAGKVASLQGTIDQPMEEGMLTADTAAVEPQRPSTRNTRSSKL